MLTIISAASSVEVAHPHLALLNRPSYNFYMLEKNKAAQELVKLGGKKGGKARAEKLSPERRKEIAREAAKARWAKKLQQEEEG